VFLGPPRVFTPNKILICSAVFVCTWITGGPNQNYAKVGQRGSGSHDLLTLGPSRISGIAEAGCSGAWSVCNAFNVAFARFARPLDELLCGCDCCLCRWLVSSENQLVHSHNHNYRTAVITASR